MLLGRELMGQRWLGGTRIHDRSTDRNQSGELWFWGGRKQGGARHDVEAQVDGRANLPAKPAACSPDWSIPPTRPYTCRCSAWSRPCRCREGHYALAPVVLTNTANFSIFPFQSTSASAWRDVRSRNIPWKTRDTCAFGWPVTPGQSRSSGITVYYMTAESSMKNYILRKLSTLSFFLKR
jgi:hypothetical protein